LVHRSFVSDRHVDVTQSAVLLVTYSRTSKPLEHRDRPRSASDQRGGSVALSPRRRRNGAGTHPGSDNESGVAPIQFRLEAARDNSVSASGEPLTGRGYVLCDAQTEAPLGDDDFFFRIGGGMVTEVVDCESHPNELQNVAFSPGRALSMVRHPASGTNEVPTVEVFDLTGTVKAGELKPEIADAVTFYGADTYEAAFCLYEWRDSSARRVALRLLLAPGWTVEELPERAN
jgi:hypothetical protein